MTAEHSTATAPVQTPPKRSRRLVYPLLFLHIPKTAGTTIHYILNNNYRWRFDGFRFIGIYTNTAYKKSQLFADLAPEKRRRIKLIKGHLHFDTFKNNYPGEITCFTFLRDPVKRCISGYNFIRQNTVHPFHKQAVENNYTLKEILQQGFLPQLDNGQVRFLSSSQHLEFGQVNEETYRKALQVFDTHFELFGLCERFDESILHLSRRLGWRHPHYLKANATDKQKSIMEFDGETMQLLQHYNRYDALLYAHARKKFDAAISAYGERFQEDLAHYRRVNERQAPVRRLVRKVINVILRVKHL